MAKTTFLELAKNVLTEEKRPLSPSEIWKIAVAKGYDSQLATKGKTPASTLYSAIFTDARINPNTVFIKVGARPARYFLKELAEAQQPAELERAASAQATVPEKFNYLDILDLLRYSLLRTTPALIRKLPDTRSNGMIAGFQVQVRGLSDPSTDYLSLRTGGSTSSKELRQLPEGTLLKVRRSKDGWQQVELLNGMTGWVLAKYVGRVDQGTDAVAENGESGPEAIGPAEQVRHDRVIHAAITFLDDLVVYLKLHPETPDIASVAQEVSKLKSVIDNNDVPAIEATTETLKRRMEAVSGFPDFVRTRTEERRQAEIRALGK
jgi:HB1, ASXL, restriction endonuclease HTH domain/Bacterial SH3 domain